jgi:hypothetical protein
MRPVYAVEFKIRRDGEQGDIAADVRGASLTWIADWYQVHHGLPVTVDEHGDIMPLAGHRIATSLDAAPSGEQLWLARWSYPSDIDAGVLWSIELAVAEADGDTEFSLVLGVGSADFVIAPPEFDLKPPRLVKFLVDSHACALGGTPLRSTYQEVTPDSVDTFVDYLRSKDRRLPVVLFSRDAYSDAFLLASPVKAAWTLVALADVRTIGKEASLRLTDRVGKWYACFNGAGRVYWPGTRADGAPRADRPLFVREAGHRSDEVIRTLMGRVASVSAFRFTEMETTKKARLAIEARRSAESRTLRETAAQLTKQAGNVKTVIDGLMASVDTERAEKAVVTDSLGQAELRISELEQEKQELEAAKADLHRALDIQTQNVAAFRAWSPSAEDAGAPTSTDLDPPDTVSDAVERARTEYAGTLLFAEDVNIDTDESGEFWWGVLTSLHQLCQKEQTGQLKGADHSEVVLAELLGANGCPHKRPKHKDTDLYRTDPRTKKKVHLRWRLILASGPLSKTECVYWEPTADKRAEKRYLIGRIGEHA